MADKNITILHLSDMQFGIHHRFFGKEDSEFDTLLERLHIDLSGLKKDCNLTPDLVILTGDLTERGKKPEFDDLFTFVTGLSEKLNIPHNQIIMIPGNHDINWTICENYFRRCDEYELKPKEPYWEKWEFYKDFFDKFYAGESTILFTKERPYSLFEIEEFKIVVAGLNSTMRESHRDGDHYGWVGEGQLRWFMEELETYKLKGWFRIAAVHHNIQRGETNDNENLHDADKFKRLLKDSVNLVLHGHTHQADLERLPSAVPILATGSAALKQQIRPNDTPNQYQIIQVSSNNLKRYCRAFTGKEWTRDSHVHKDSPKLFEETTYKFENVHAVFDGNNEPLIPIEEQTTDIISVTPLQINANNIPQPRDYFTGRKNELQRFTDILKHANLITIEGIGGIGKTEFAAEYINQYLATKNKVVWFDCETSNTLDALISQAGYVDLLKGENKTDLAKYSGFVDLIERDQRYLFLDNYQEASDLQFIEFFKFAERKLKHAKLILISREHPKIDGILISSFLIEGLDFRPDGSGEALAYAQAIQQNCYQHIQIGIDVLTKICADLNGHPLAIEFAFQLLSYGESPDNILQKIVEYKVNNQELSNRLLAEVFEHPNSTDDEKQLLCRFAIFRGKVDRAAITAINDNQDPMPILTRLIDKLMIRVSNEQYQTHPLIREFCYQKLDDPRALHEKAAIYFQQSSHDSFSLTLIEQIFYHFSQAKNRQGIEALILKHAEYLLLTGHYQFLQTMIQQAELQGSIATEFNLYNGSIAQIKGEWQHALGYFKKVLSTKSANENVVLEALNRYGEMCWRQGEYQEALVYFERAYQGSERFNKAKADALHGIGLVYLALNDLTKAEEAMLQALAIRQAALDKKGMAISLNDLAAILNKRDKPDEALEKYEQSLLIRQGINDKEGIALTLDNIGTFFLKKHNLPEALKKYQEGLKIQQEIGNKPGIAISLGGIGNVFFQKGNLPEALKKYQESLEICQDIGHKRNIIYDWNNIGNCYFANRNNELSISYFVQALALANKIGLKEGVKLTETNIFKARRIINPKKFKLLLEKAYFKLPAELKPYFDISIF